MDDEKLESLFIRPTKKFQVRMLCEEGFSVVFIICWFVGWFDGLLRKEFMHDQTWQN